MLVEGKMVCATCGNDVGQNDIECPVCGEPFTDEAFNLYLDDEKPERNWLLIIGIVLVIIGGPGIAVFSWVHDIAKIPIANFNNFDSFGWANRMTAAAGMIVLIVGLALILFSLLRSRNRYKDEAAEEIDI